MTLPTKMMQHNAGSSAKAVFLGASLFAASANGAAAAPASIAAARTSVVQAKNTSASVLPESVSSNQTNNRPKSVFSAQGKDAHDPFFPGSVRFQEKIASAFGVSAVTNLPPVDAISLLADGFQGIFRTELDRLALVNNTILERGKNSEILIGPIGNQQRIKVHCLDITRNSVVITVPGRAEPVVLTLKFKGIDR